MNRSHPLPSPGDAHGTRVRSQHLYRASPAEEHDAAKAPAFKAVRRDAARRAEADEEIRALMNGPRDRR